MSDLLTALKAMDQLNRWVRFRGAARPRKAVYWLKSRYAIRDAIMSGMTTRMRLVESIVKCTRCENGTYYDWEGRDRGQCYHCDGRGTAHLKFVETQIDNRFTWHTPLQYRSWLGWPMDDLEPGSPNNWEPNQPGIELPIEDAARLLNIVEEFWPQWQTEKPYDLGYDDYDTTRYYFFNYVFELPREPNGTPCALCGNPETKMRCHAAIAPGFEAARAVCAQCEKRGSVFNELKLLPKPEILSYPDVDKWRRRHEAAFADIWKLWRKPWEETA